MVVKTYWNINREAIVPTLRIGLSDFFLTIFIFVGGFFGAIPLSQISYTLAFVLFFIILISDFLLFSIARKEFNKNGRTEVVGKILDYYFSKKFLEGRELKGADWLKVKEIKDDNRN